MFIGLIFDIMLLIFVVVAVLLVFSLILISVETKAFEFGVMRLVGLTKLGFVAIIFTQASMFVLPAVILAFLCSFPLIYYIFSTMIGDDLGYMPSILPSGKAILIALFLGVAIPFASSIVPIRRGLAANLNDTLSSTRSKTKGALVSVIDTKVLNIVPYLLYGSLAVCLGVLVYYGLPSSLLELNLGMILTIFFILLLCMLVGLVLVASNLQPALEYVLMYLMLFWEQKSMRTLIRKNMIAHRKKNRLTAIIYALSLGCIIFILTSANLEVNLILG